jgi:hypothetical protein
MTSSDPNHLLFGNNPSPPAFLASFNQRQADMSYPIQVIKLLTLFGQKSTECTAVWIAFHLLGWSLFTTFVNALDNDEFAIY